ncbi:MAG: hypothetical protein ACOYD0_06095 [Candidatus Nanopelagicales bacterium]
MTEATADRRLVGIYNADGGLRGELSYLAGKVRGTSHCELCDITHSPVRRKKSWDALLATLDLPFTLLHRNELNEPLASELRGVPLPTVVLVSGSIPRVLLGPEQLARCGSDVTTFGRMLREALAQAR